MLRFIGSLAFFMCLISFSNAQVKKGVLKEERSLLYRNEAFGSISLHSGGWGIGFRKGKHVTGDKKRMFDFDLVSMKHPKEYKSPNGFDSPFFYGKTNSLMILRTGYGYQTVLYNKAERGGVEIRYLYYGGISWGFTKPVYLEVFDGGNNIYTTKFDASIAPADIRGGASFFRGFDEIGFHPGLYGKLGLTFEYGNKDKDVKAIETGVVVDGFPKAVPIMALIENKKVFLSFYISFLYGKKW